jgi:hypothetical protein
MKREDKKIIFIFIFITLSKISHKENKLHDFVLKAIKNRSFLLFVLFKKIVNKSLTYFLYKRGIFYFKEFKKRKKLLKEGSLETSDIYKN